MTSAADLFALQELDLRRDARRAMIADIDARLGETDELIEAREAVEDAEAAAQRLRRRQKELDTQMQDLDAKIAPIEKRLYDGSVRNPKELTDMQKELDHFKRERGKLDDQGLELLDGIERATNAASEAHDDLKQIESTWHSDQERMQADRLKAESDFISLEAQRAKHTENMDRGSLGLYESLRGQKQGRAVARVERGTCQGCRISLPTHLVQRLRGGGLLIQCPTCERILVAG
ncbi:MAG TPA: C4-type zinc ribbon domain-containing protein [Dehalococcoidia bacterium]|nr:C4-type zinc ribbon domain-containing protein [Dehalococcoidia bacterium]